MLPPTATEICTAFPPSLRAAEASFINKLRSHYTSSGSAHGFSIKASPGHEIRGDSPAPGGPPAAAPATLEEQEWAVWEQREGELAESQVGAPAAPVTWLNICTTTVLCNC